MVDFTFKVLNNYVIGKIVDVIMNYFDPQYGLNMMLKSEDGLTLLARSMDPNYASMMADVVKLMAAVCLVK